MIQLGYVITDKVNVIRGLAYGSFQDDFLNKTAVHH